MFSVARIGVPREVPVVGSRAPKSPSKSLARTTKRLGLRGLLLLLLLPPPIPDNLRLLCCRNPWLALKEEEEEEEQDELANAEREESEESTTVNIAEENAKAIIPHAAAQEVGSLGRGK